jgi:hypothetical protein
MIRRPEPALLWARLRNARRLSGIEEDWIRFLRESASEGRFTKLSIIIWRTWHLLFWCLLSTRRRSFLSTDLVTLPLPAGVLEKVRRSGPKVGYTFLIRSAFSTRRVTQYLGFPHYGDEYKVMGLAPYGRPSFLDALRQLVVASRAAASV